MKKYSLEFSVGIFVLVGLLCLAYMTIKLGKMEVFANDGYTLSARFASITGLKVGASVEMAGVPVGKVTAIDLDKDYYAQVSLQLQKGVQLGDDSIASVKTSGAHALRFSALPHSSLVSSGAMAHPPCL